jgi:hypothetical protein
MSLVEALSESHPEMSLVEALNEPYPAIPETAPLARRVLAAVAATAGVAGERLDEIRLAVSEADLLVLAHGELDEPVAPDSRAFPTEANGSVLVAGP